MVSNTVGDEVVTKSVVLRYLNAYYIPTTEILVGPGEGREPSSKNTTAY